MKYNLKKSSLGLTQSFALQPVESPAIEITVFIKMLLLV